MGNLKISNISVLIIWLILNTSSPAQTVPDAYEPDNNFNEASVIEINNLPQQRSFHVSGDEDWAAFYAIADVKYDILISNVSLQCDPVIELIDTDGLTTLRGPWSMGFEGEDEFISHFFAADGVYFIKVKDVNNAFGENVSYSLQVDIVIGSDAGDIKGVVQDNSGDKIEKVRIKTTANASNLSKTDGTYNLFKHNPGTYTLIAEKEGYERYEAQFALNQKEVFLHNIVMNPMHKKGDINGDTFINLIDVILGLQVIAGFSEFSDEIYLQADVNKDGIIGTEEVLYILQYVSGFRH